MNCSTETRLSQLPRPLEFPYNANESTLQTASEERKHRMKEKGIGNKPIKRRSKDSTTKTRQIQNYRNDN